MKLNYGLKVGDRVKGGSGNGTILEIFKAGKNGLGFKHASVKYDNGERWDIGLYHLKKLEATK